MSEQNKVMAVVLGVHNPVPRVIHQDYSLKAGGILVIANTHRSEQPVEGQEKSNKIWKELFLVEVPGVNSIQTLDEVLRYMRAKISAVKANKPTAEHPKAMPMLEIDFQRQPADGGKIEYFAIFRTTEGLAKEEKFLLPVANEAEFDLHLEHIKWTTGVAYRKRLAVNEGQLIEVLKAEAPVLTIKTEVKAEPVNAEHGEGQAAPAPAQQEEEPAPAVNQAEQVEA